MNTHKISPRERQVLELVAYENTNNEIAEKLYISNQTVKTHRKNLLEKLSVRNTAGLVRRSFELGLLELKEHYQMASIVFTLTFFCVSLKAQTYSTPGISFSPEVSFVNAAFLPNPICGSTSGVTSSSMLDALGACEAEYLLARKGESFSFVVNVTHRDQIGSSIVVSYVTDAATPQESTEQIFSAGLFSPGEEQSDVFGVSHTPEKGSLGDIIHIQITATSGTYNIYIPVAVEGVIDDRVPILGNFLTPMIPYLILHDPPGDISYSEFTQTDKYCRTQSTTLAKSDSKGFSATVQVGIELSVEVFGVGGTFTSTVATTGSLNITSEVSEGIEQQSCVEFKKTVATGKLESQIGPSEDRYIGAGAWYKYGVYDQVMVVNCELTIEKGLVYATDSDSAQIEFEYTEKDIKSNLADLKSEVNDLSKSLVERERAYNQIEVWQQILDKNNSNRENEDYPTKISQSSNSDPTAKTDSYSTSAISNISYNVALEAGVAVEVTVLAIGNGFYGGPQFSFNTTRSGSLTTEEGLMKEITAFVGDNDDQLHYEVGVDPDYGTPMFRLSDNAVTSCPYEGGERLSRPRVFVQKGNNQCPHFTRDNIMVNTDTVNVTICNDHPNQAMNFDVMVSGNTQSLGLIVNGTNLDNAQNFASIGQIQPMSCMTFPLYMTKKPLVNTYDNIFLRVYDHCLSVSIPETPLLDRIRGENDSLQINVTFGGPGNYPPDMDCDGVPDSADPCPNVTSEGDDDCDGIVNSNDACPLDPNNSDADLDGFLDCVDLCPNQLDGTLNFDRSSLSASDNDADYIQIPHHPLLNLPQGDFTIEAWVKPGDDFFKTIASKGISSPGQNVFIFNIWQRHELQPNSGRLALFVGGFWQYSDNQVPLNVWSHVAVTYSADVRQASFYIDGQFSGTRTFPNAPVLADSEPFYIGRLGNSAFGNQNCFKGAMDDMIIWNRKLEQEEIILTMSHSLAGNEDNLVAYYRFDQHPPCAAGGPTSLLDSGPNTLTGSLVNFDLGTNTNGKNNPCESNWSEGRNADINKDGLGDICTPIPCLSQDTDNDGYSDCIDLCPNTSDAALHFDGTNWAETISDPNIVGHSSFAFSAWIYPTSDEFLTIAGQGNGANFQTAFLLFKVKGDGSIFEIKDHNKIGLYLYNGSTLEVKLSDSPVPLNEWSHVAISISGSTATFYLNGEKDGSQTYSFSNWYNTNVGHLFIGRPGNAGVSPYFQGRLDDIYFWSKSLKVEEVKALYGNSVNGNEANLIAGYNFNNQGVPCKNNQGSEFVFDVSMSGQHLLNLWNFDLASDNCHKNWTRARNTDSDGNGIGDACETSRFACASTAGTGGAGPDSDYLEDCLDLCPTSTQTSLQFSGHIYNDSVTIAHNSDFNLADGNFTLELWIKPGEINNDVSLINKGHGTNNATIYNLVIKGNEIPQLRHKVGLNMSGDWVFSNSRIKSDQWTHIAVTFDIVTKTIRFYVNGELDSQPRILPSGNPLYNADTGTLSLGRDKSGVTGKLTAAMEDVIIWDKTLTDKEILRSMKAPLKGTETRIVAYYKFDDGIPFAINLGQTTLSDSGPNNYDGQLQGFGLVGINSNWAPGRNTDSDGDGVGDGCDDGLPCPPNYVGINALDNSLEFSFNYETNGMIETSQMIHNPVNVIYNSSSAVNLLPGFELNHAILEVKVDGCNQN